MGGEIMTCQELQSQLLLKMSGELPDEQVRQLDAHLASCAACRQEAALLSRMVSSTKFAVQRGQPSSAVLAQIETAGRARLETVAWQRQMFRRWVPAAAAALLLVGVGLQQRYSARLDAVRSGRVLAALVSDNGTGSSLEWSGAGRHAELQQLAQQLMVLQGIGEENELAAVYED